MASLPSRALVDYNSHSGFVLVFISSNDRNWCMLFIFCQEREKYGQMVTRFQGQTAELQQNVQMEIEQRQKMQVLQN